MPNAADFKRAYERGRRHGPSGRRAAAGPRPKLVSTCAGHWILALVVVVLGAAPFEAAAVCHTGDWYTNLTCGDCPTASGSQPCDLATDYWCDDGSVKRAARFWWWNCNPSYEGDQRASQCTSNPIYDAPAQDEVCATGDVCDSFGEDCEPEPSNGDGTGAGGGQGRQDTDSACDTAGTDPIQLSTKAAYLDPFVDFSYEGIGSIKFERTYSSADGSVPKPGIRAATAAGAFGRGWHHNWEAYLTCQSPATSSATCTLVRGLKSQKTFNWTTGQSASQGSETWDYFTRKGIEAVYDGDQDLLVRRRSAAGADVEFVIYGVDGSELHFQQYPASDTANCAYADKTYCPAAWGAGAKDVMSGGKAALAKVVSPAGQVTMVTKSIRTGLLLSLQNGSTGTTLELRNEPSDPSLARHLLVNGVEYVSYSYALDTTMGTSGYDLTSVVATPDARTLRSYAYNSDRSHPGHLFQVRGEAANLGSGQLLVEFGYDSSHRATRVTDELSDVTVAYQSASTILVGRAASASGGMTSTHRRSGGRSTAIGSGTSALAQLAWAQRKVNCFSDAAGRTTWLNRDADRRITRVRRFPAGLVTCADARAPDDKVPASDVRLAYGLERTVGPGVPTVKLDIPTSVSQASLVSTGGLLVRSYDFSPGPAVGDPAGYHCVPPGVTLPVGAAPCRLKVQGFTRTLTGVTVSEALVTYYTYDANAQLTMVVGPVSVARPYADDVAPVETRTYYDVAEPQVARRGRLKTLERSTSGSVNDTNAFAATLDYGQTGVSSVRVRRSFVPPTSLVEDIFTLVNDSRGRPTIISGPAGATSLEYFDARLPSVIVSPAGGAYAFDYWPFGRLKAIKALASDPRPQGANPALLWHEARDYDGAGNPILVQRFDSSGARRFSQAQAFRADHRPLSATHPSDLSRQATWEYDPSGITTAFVDELGIRTEMPPDPTGRAAGVSRVVRDASMNILQQLGLATYTWEGPVDLVRTVTDGAGRTTTYAHDDFGRVTSVDAPAVVGSAPVRLEWDARSNLKRRALGGATVSYAYDGLDRPTSVVATSTAGATPVYQAFTYDFDGRPGSMVGRIRTASAGSAPGDVVRTTTFDWNPAGLLESERVQVGGFTPLKTGYLYNANGRLTSVTYPSGFAAAIGMDEADQVTSISGRSRTGGVRALATQVKHEPLGPLRSLQFGNGLTMLRTSNLRYEPDLLATGPLAFDYAMGWSGDVDGIVTNVADSRSFTYDLANRLASMSPGLAAGSPSLTYDYAGAAVTRSRSPVGTTLTPVHAFGYDLQRSLTAVGRYDPSGVSIPSTTCLLHDALGRLIAVGPALARLSGPGATACQREADLASVNTRFEYDAFNRRVSRLNGSAATEYVHSSSGQLLAELARPATATEPWNTTREYVWLDELPLAQLQYPGPPDRTDGYTYYLHLDHVGTPRALTGESSTTVWSAVPARPYGDMVESTTPDPLNGRTVVTNLRLPGQYHERGSSPTDAGLLASVGLQGPYYNWNRWYLPTLGRYLELDPIALQGDFNVPFGVDWYGYADQNPLRTIDPSGLYGTNDCSYYADACAKYGGKYYCQDAPKWCNRFPKQPDPNPGPGDHYEGWARCTRQCLQDCDASEHKNDNACPTKPDNRNGPWDLRYWKPENKSFACHAACYSWCAAPMGLGDPNLPLRKNPF